MLDLKSGRSWGGALGKKKRKLQKQEKPAWQAKNTLT